MAPMIQDSLDVRIQDVIQNLYDIQSDIHGYLGPETQQELIRKIHQLTSSLSTLSTSASPLPITLPPEIIDYIDGGRNPDIYTREMVEVVQRNNAYLKGKSEAFGGFRDKLAEEIVRAMPDKEGDVKDIVEGNRIPCGDVSNEDSKVNGTAGS